MNGLALDSGEFISADELNARIPQSKPDNWQQYATEREETAQAVIERHRGEINSLLNLLAKDRGELQALRAQIGQGEPTDEQIMATVQQKGFGFSQSRPLAQQWDQVCELIRAVVRERNTHPAPQTSVVDDNSPSDLDYSPPGHGVDGFETPSQGSVVQQKPLLDEKKLEMWTNATIECCTHMACYMRGIEDAEAAHGIGEKK